MKKKRKKEKREKQGGKGDFVPEHEAAKSRKAKERSEERDRRPDAGSRLEMRGKVRETPVQTLCIVSQIDNFY